MIVILSRVFRNHGQHFPAFLKYKLIDVYIPQVLREL